MPTLNRSANRIAGLLKPCTGTYRPHEVFIDWLDVVHATMEQVPQHLLNITSGKQLTEPPETSALFAEKKARYSEASWRRFQEAYAVLLESATMGWHDTLGDTYMEFAYPNSRKGQFFTPSPVALFMALAVDTAADVQKHIKKAIYDNHLALANFLASLALDEEQSQERFFKNVLPLVFEKIEPVRVTDPCCGSGVMFLSVASTLPPWALDLGLVQFYGIDIDPTCCKMAETNMMLYGLNGYGLKLRASLAASQQAIKNALELTPAQMSVVPEPLQTAYSQAQAAHRQGDDAKVEEIKLAIRKGQYNFFNLMEQEVTAPEFSKT